MKRKLKEEYMRRAIELAKGGEGWAHPNPLVGAVIVKDDRIIGEGCHQRYGQLHAERNAIANLRERAKGATLYVTLEPCCHYGKTPPCTEAIIEEEIGRVVIGSRDPNPKVAGKGVRILREAGVEVVEDFLREECDRLNEIFFHYIREKTPYVIMKYAMTADGKIATKTGASKWITGEESRHEVQKLRHRCMGIMAGIGTVLRDDPLLTCRLEGGRSPVRIICDSRLRIPAGSAIVSTARETETIVVCARPDWPRGELTAESIPHDKEEGPAPVHGSQVTAAPTSVASSETREGAAPASVASSETREDAAPASGPWAKALALLEAGVRLVNFPADPETADRAPGGEPVSEGVDLSRLMEFLGQEKIDSILLEGGGRLNESALRAGIVQEIQAFVAPKIFGGRASSPVEGEGAARPDQGQALELAETEIIGGDIRLTYRVQPRKAAPEKG